jgi:hypothetical protein
LFAVVRNDERVTEPILAVNETARIEAFSDGVFAIAITLLILEIQVPPQAPPGGLRLALAHLWPSYLAFLASFMTIGIMWLNHHRLFTLINKKDDWLIALNLTVRLHAWDGSRLVAEMQYHNRVMPLGRLAHGVHVRTRASELSGASC